MCPPIYLHVNKKKSNENYFTCTLLQCKYIYSNIHKE